jgi:predicted transcriptional regulator/transcriptional regulator with XRE-family HTH domain
VKTVKKIRRERGLVAKSIWLGNKIRRLRREQDIAQVALARDLGISASYLNMIERNQRPVTLRLLEKSAEVFGLSTATLAEDDDARILAELTELFGDPVFRETVVSRDDLQEIINVAPAAGQAMVQLYRVFRQTREDVESLRERMTDDNFLSTSAHELRSVLTPIRSFAEILHDHDNISSKDQRRFAGILVRESERLAEIIDRMLSLTSGDATMEPEGVPPASEQVHDMLQEQRNYFPEIEETAQSLLRQIGQKDVISPGTLIENLCGHFDIALDVVSNGLSAASGPAAKNKDDTGPRVIVPEALPISSRAFRLAKHIALRHYATEIEHAIPERLIVGESGRSLCRNVLAGYFAGALLMPYQEFHDAVQATRYNIESLQHRFQVSFEQVCHRMTTLQRPDAAGVPFHLIRVDIAGNISKRFSLSGMRMPRYGGLCPRLNVHTAFMTPGRISRQVAQMPDGATFFTVARSVSKPGFGPQGAVGHYAVAIGCDVTQADQFSYSDGIDLEAPSIVMPAGVTCRLCDRLDCAQRAHPPILRLAEAEADTVAPA